MAKKKLITPEEARKQAIDSAIAELKRMIALGAMPLNPTRTFNVDERVLWEHMMKSMSEKCMRMAYNIFKLKSKNKCLNIW